MTGVQQVDEVVVRSWDHTAKRAIEATAKPEPTRSAIGIARDSVASALGGGAHHVADAARSATRRRPTRSPRAVMAQLANAYLEAEGTCQRRPAACAPGSTLKIEGVGTRFSGTYRVSSTVHAFRGAKGYETRFTSPAARRAASSTCSRRPSARAGSRAACRWRLVTQNDDPRASGGVRVKYPALGDDTEGWWARIAAPGAGKDRGLLMMPMVGDEVLVAFEHGDVRRPYVLGSLWNGEDTPGDLVQTDGSFRLRSARERRRRRPTRQMELEAVDELTVKVGDASVVLKKDGSITIKSSAAMTLEGRVEHDDQVRRQHRPSRPTARCPSRAPRCSSAEAATSSAPASPSRCGSTRAAASPSCPRGRGRPRGDRA